MTPNLVRQQWYTELARTSHSVATASHESFASCRWHFASVMAIRCCSPCSKRYIFRAVRFPPPAILGRNTGSSPMCIVRQIWLSPRPPCQCASDPVLTFQSVRKSSLSGLKMLGCQYRYVTTTRLSVSVYDNHMFSLAARAQRYSVGKKPSQKIAQVANHTATGIGVVFN